MLTFFSGAYLIVGDGWHSYRKETTYFFNDILSQDFSEATIKLILNIDGAIYMIAALFLIFRQHFYSGFLLLVALIPAVVWRYNPFLNPSYRHILQSHWIKALSLCGIALVIFS